MIDKSCSLLCQRVENGETAVIFTIVSVAVHASRIDSCCSLLTLSKIPRTIGASIRLQQRDTHIHRETRFL